MQTFLCRTGFELSQELSSVAPHGRSKLFVDENFSTTNVCVLASRHHAHAINARGNEQICEYGSGLFLAPDSMHSDRRGKHTFIFRTSCEHFRAMQAIARRCKLVPLVTIHMFEHAENVIAHGLCFRVTWHTRAPCFDPNGKQLGENPRNSLWNPPTTETLPSTRSSRNEANRVCPTPKLVCIKRRRPCPGEAGNARLVQNLENKATIDT